MADSDQTVSGSERRAAKKLVKLAATDGRIVEADRDRRLEQIADAHTAGELAMILRDLRPERPAVPPTVESPKQPAPPRAAPPSPRQPPPPPPPPPAKRRGPGVVLTVALVIGGATAVTSLGDSGVDGSFSESDVFGFDGTDEFGGVDGFDDGAVDDPVESAPPAVLTRRGLNLLVRAVRGETGSTRIFQAVVYPDYAVLHVPVDPDSDRQRSLYYDGAMRDQNALGTSDRRRFDLARIDPQVVLRLIRRVSALVDGPTSTYAIIGGPRAADPDVWISVYASNDFQESANLAATQDGRVIRRTTP